MHSSEVLSNSSTENPWTRGNKIWWVGIPTFYPSDGWFWLHKLSINNQDPICPRWQPQKAHYIDFTPSLVSLTSESHFCSWDYLSNYLHISPCLRLYLSPPGSDIVFFNNVSWKELIKSQSLYLLSNPSQDLLVHTKTFIIRLLISTYL